MRRRCRKLAAVRRALWGFERGENSRLLKCVSPRNISITRLLHWVIALQSGGNAVVYAADHEPHAPNPAAREEGEPARHKEDQRHIDFLADADLEQSARARNQRARGLTSNRSTT
jgi:hypothetical protein